MGGEGAKRGREGGRERQEELVEGKGKDGKEDMREEGVEWMYTEMERISG